jgi:hypothetical protein
MVEAGSDGRPRKALVGAVQHHNDCGEQHRDQDQERHHGNSLRDLPHRQQWQK